MNVAVEVAGDGEVKPGEEVEVAVTTTDPQGRPLAAELSLAMIEQSLLDRFASNVAAIDDFFRGARRSRPFGPRRASHSTTGPRPGRSTRTCWPNGSGWRPRWRKKRRWKNGAVSDCRGAARAVRSGSGSDR